VRALTIATLLAALSTVACLPREEQAIRFLIRVHDDQGAAQRAIPVLLDGIATAVTDDAGESPLVFRPHANRVQIAVRCPSGFHSPDPRTLAVSRAGHQAPLELAFVCRPLKRTLLVIVRAPQAVGLPVLADGESLGTVQVDGSFHGVLERPPEAVVRLMLDTSEAPLLLPQNPVREFRVADQDEIVVFDQALAPAPPARRARVTPRVSAAAQLKAHVPYAIGPRH
jgi:hypothetical protein